MTGLSKQERVVYEYIKNHPGCTTHDITRDTFVQKPCARIVGIEKKGVVVKREGQIKYEGSRPFERLWITETLKKTVFKPHFLDNGTVRMVKEEVEV